MARIAYVNGRYVTGDLAAVSIEDRGYQFADGVYEVIWVQQGKPVDLERHFDRLDCSLDSLNIPWPMSRRALGVVVGEVLRRNFTRNGHVYIQATRGAARRNHLVPEGTAPSLVVTASREGPRDAAIQDQGVGVITIPDIRWKRCDIKSIALLPNILGKQKASREKAFDAWQVNGHDIITEGTTTNAWIVDEKDEVITHPANHHILSGITRRVVMELAEEGGLQVTERPFTVAEARAASEAFMTSTTNYVVPVVSIDGHKVGDGRPGPVTRGLYERYLAHVTGE
ncbi:MAG: D-amino-acid transaminase [Alphaproteobacteria bacterium]|nr:D-amino-acid transaminase [Alphaproteobacteria bacterium]